jgi:PAS domain S-box-containing protein
MSKRILLVEDEALIAMVEARTLKEYGYEVVTAHNGTKAIEAIDTDPDISLILMDIDLGRGIDGTEAAREILKKKDIPVLFLSSHTEPEVVERTEKITSYGYVVKSSSITVLDASIKMAFKLFDASTKEKEIEAALRESEEMMRNSESLAHICSYSTNLNLYELGKSAFVCSPELYKIFGIDTSYPHTLAGWAGFIHPDHRRETVAYYQHVVKERIPFQHEYKILRINDGAERWVIGTGKLEFDEEGTSVRMHGAIQDITDRKQQEEELVANKNLLMTFINSIPDAIFYKNPEGRYLLVNKAKMKQLGVQSTEEVIGKTVHDFFPKNQANIFTETERRYLENERPPHFWEEKVATLEGGHVWHFNTKVLVRDIDDNPLGILTICRDITQEKVSEQNVKSLLAKNKLILKETHHRVKNNLHTILNLLSLQAGSEETPEVRSKLKDAVGRVRSMTVLYDKLYRSDTFSELSMTDFLPPLIDQIVGVFPSSPPVRTEVRVEEMVLSSKILSPLGIIINELITNSMKYAFKGRDSGVITVTVTRKDGRVTIVYEDNGVGLPESVDFTNPGGFGMQLIQMLTEQIDGTVHIERQAGTKYVIEVES